MMTDNEIIKAMECVIGNDANCSECTYQNVLPFPSCRRMCAKNALDLINRQKAEIERLQRELANKYRNCTFVGSVPVHTEHLKDYARFLYLVKSEAIKEFAEQLRKRFYFIDGHCVVDIPQINNLVKAMTEVEE